MEMSLALCLPREMHLRRSSSNVPRPPSFSKLLQSPHVYSLLSRCRIHCTCHAKPHPNFKENGPRPSGTFDFETCFAPQPQSLCPQCLAFLPFWLRNLLRATTAWQKCSEPPVLSAFWLPSVLRATFSSAQRPKVIRCCGAFNILTRKCAWRHNGIHFFEAQLPKVLRPWSLLPFWLRDVLRATGACNFWSLIQPALASLLFDPPKPQNIGKQQSFTLIFVTGSFFFDSSQLQLSIGRKFDF